jgi:putative heme transporter
MNPKKVLWIAALAGVVYAVVLVWVLNNYEIPPISGSAGVLIAVAGLAQIAAKWFFGSLFRESVQETGLDLKPYSAFKAAMVGAGVARLIPAGGAITPVAMSWTVRDEVESSAGPAIRTVLLNYAGLLILAGAAILLERPTGQVLKVSLTIGAPIAVVVGLVLMFGSGKLGSLNKYFPEFLRKKLGPTMVNHLPGWESQLYIWLRLGMEALALGLVLHAFDIDVTVLETLAVFGVSQLVGGLPGTPGGLGVVEAGLVFVLGAYGFPAATTVAPVVVYRIVSYWLPVALSFFAGGSTFLKSQEASDAAAER